MSNYPGLLAEIDGHALRFCDKCEVSNKIPNDISCLNGNSVFYVSGFFTMDNGLVADIFTKLASSKNFDSLLCPLLFSIITQYIYMHLSDSEKPGLMGNC